MCGCVCTCFVSWFPLFLRVGEGSQPSQTICDVSGSGRRTSKINGRALNGRSGAAQNESTLANNLGCSSLFESDKETKFKVATELAMRSSRSARVERAWWEVLKGGYVIETRTRRGLEWMS